MLAPQYTNTTPIGEECHHLKFFDKEIDSQATIGELTFITLKNKTTFWIKESEWIQIQRQIKLNKLIK